MQKTDLEKLQDCLLNGTEVLIPIEEYQNWGLETEDGRDFWGANLQICLDKLTGETKLFEDIKIARCFLYKEQRWIKESPTIASGPDGRLSFQSKTQVISLK